jgi:hypothetical protein
MTENPQAAEDLKKNGEKPCEEKQKPSPGEDQKKHVYYYDDAHGYEIYDAGAEEDEDEK